MVEHDHVVVERERQVGQVAIVGRRVGQLLDVADDVVAGIADRAAGERRQLRQRGRAQRLDAAFEFFERIVGS